MIYIIGYVIAWPFAGIATALLLSTGPGQEFLARVVPYNNKPPFQPPRFGMNPEPHRRDWKKIAVWTLIFLGPIGFAAALLGYLYVVLDYYRTKSAQWVAAKLKM